MFKSTPLVAKLSLQRGYCRLPAPMGFTVNALSCIMSTDFSQSVASVGCIEGLLAVPSDVV
jgi:hypothetical protein